MEAVTETDSPFFITEDVAAVDSFDIEPRNKEEAFFFQYNPGFKQGHYLGFCVKFTLLRMLQCFSFFVYKRFKKQRQQQSGKQQPVQQ